MTDTLRADHRYHDTVLIDGLKVHIFKGPKRKYISDAGADENGNAEMGENGNVQLGFVLWAEDFSDSFKERL